MLINSGFTVLNGDEKRHNIIPKVAIVIATHYRPEYLENAINSILNQNFSNYSIIIVENGNCFYTESFCKSIIKMDSRIRYLKFESGKGAAKTRNFGLFKISKEVEKVFFLDDDDLFFHEYSLADLFNSSKDNPILTYGVQLDVNSDYSIHNIWPCFKNSLSDFIVDYNKIQFPAHTVLWDTCFYKKIGGFSLKYENDMEDIASIIKGFGIIRDSKKIKFSDTPITCWRRGDISENKLMSIAKKDGNKKKIVRQNLIKDILKFQNN